MYIICGKCSKRFIDVAAARAHIGHCTGDDGGATFFVPSSIDQFESNTAHQENNDQPNNKSIRPEDISQITCPSNKKQEFPCPRCCYSESVTELRALLKATTWWYCKYPNIVNLKMLTIEDIEKEK